jgi:restriction system protein
MERTFLKKRKKTVKEKKDDTELEDDQQLIKAKIDELEEEALEGLRSYLKEKNPYEFQDMVAALLRAMKYHTPFISPRGTDGGVDVIAYRDPLGVKSPRIKVQVKHRPNDTVSVKEIRSLIGILNKDSDIGLFVTSGKFSSDSENLSRDSHVHIKLIDFEDFISFWKEFYDELTDEEKNMLPLKSISFLGSNE